MKLILVVTFIGFTLNIYGQSSSIYTSDIDNFWVAYDSLQSTTDSTKQVDLIQRLYLDKATAGFRKFILSKNISAKCLLASVRKYPDFWKSIRPNSLHITHKKVKLDAVLKSFKSKYAAFKAPELYFFIGCLNNGGTTSGQKVLIAAEIASANAETNSTELDNRMQQIMLNLNDISHVVAHEIVHTQQQSAYYGETLLAKCLVEGSADFIAELVLESPFTTAYTKYGMEHEQVLWLKFKDEMYDNQTAGWLYNGNDPATTIPDLGYFMGYMICKSYYEKAANKEKAIKEIIELTPDIKSIKQFLKKSGYADKW